MSYTDLHLFLLIISSQWLSTDTNSFFFFPIQEFFNEPTSDEILSKYVCSYKPEEEKYCTCLPTYFKKHNWCIDVFWKDKANFTLQTYIEYLKEKYLKLSAKNNYRTCEPIIYPVPANHLVERVMMYSTYVEENNTRKRCVKGYDTPSLPVYDETNSNVYINEFCAIANKVKKFSTFEVKALCLNSEDVHANMTLNSNVVEKLDQCEFSLDEKSGMRLYQCASENNECPEEDEYYVLCNAYLAPTNGYRNRHCYVCANRKNTDTKKETTIEVNECRKTRKSVCRFPHTGYRFFSKSLIYIDYDGERNNLRIARLENIFPAAKFYKAYKHQFDTKIKNGPHGCCIESKSCWKFKACCDNRLWNRSKLIDLDIYKELFINNTIRYKDHNCARLIPHSRYPKPSHYLMITTCLSNATKDEISACTSVSWQNAQSYMPVIGEDDYLYRNSYCALCNSIRKFSYVTVKSALKKKGFVFEIDQPSENIVQTCEMKMPSNTTCPLGHPYQQLCKSFLEPTQSYRNIFCHLCNHPNDEITLYDCIDKRTFHPWSDMITLNHHGKIQVSSPYNNKPNLELVRFLEKRCMELECEDFQGENVYQTIDRDIKPLKEKCMGNKDKITLYVMKKGNRIWNNIINNLMLILNVTGYEFERKTNNPPLMRLDFNLSVNEIISKYDELNSTLLKYGNIGLIMSHEYESTVDIIEHFIKNDESESRRQKVCHSVEKWNESISPSLTNCSVNNINTKSQINSYFHHLLDKNGLSTYFGQCKKYTLFPKNCRMKSHKNNIANGQITYPSVVNKIMIKPYDFGFPSWATFSIECPIVKTTSIFHQAEGYLSNIGTFISIICYVFLIITYRINNRLWNIPGQLVVALTVSLLVGDTMYLVAWLLRVTGYNQIFELCEIVGILMHLSLMTAHALNVVIGYDMVMRFTMLNTRWFINDTKKLIRIIIGVIFFCVLLVLVAILCDYFNIVLIGYGRDGICIPYKPQGRLYFYIIPVAITFLLSLTCIGFVVYSVWKESKRNQNTFRGAVGRRDINLILLTFKLTLALGLIEGIGFIQVIELRDKPMLKSVFSLLYSLFRSLRGLMLVLVFVCKKDALQVYRKKFKRIDKTIGLRNLDFPRPTMEVDQETET